MFVPPPPPVATAAMSPPPTAVVARLRPGVASCAGERVSGQIEAPFPTTLRLWNGAKVPQGPGYTLTFSIDADGRPTGIRHHVEAAPGFYFETSDLGPSLAASRFEPGHARTDCTLAYTIELTPIVDAPLPLVQEVAVGPDVGSAASELFDRVRAGRCERGPGSPRRLTWPAFEAIAQPPGTRSWTFLAFDVDADGRIRNVRTTGSSGNAALNAAGRKALGENRYAPGAGVAGCTYSFYRNGETPVPAPAIPADAPVDNGDAPGCGIDPKTIPGLLNGEAFPRALMSRRIEGWAIVAYDTAPWGQIGRAKVVASEPDEAFGSAAMQAIANGRVAESETGRRGCVRRIIFRLPRSQGGPKAGLATP